MKQHLIPFVALCLIVSRELNAMPANPKAVTILPFGFVAGNEYE
jgi:hypothetical protein